jgi:hypothetical protein
MPTAQRRRVLGQHPILRRRADKSRRDRRAWQVGPDELCNAGTLQRFAVEIRSICALNTICGTPQASASAAKRQV